MSDIKTVLPEADQAVVKRALRRLPYLEREALLMKARDRMTYAEISLALGLSTREAEARVASALLRLRARLDPARPRWPFCFRFRLPCWRLPWPPHWRDRG